MSNCEQKELVAADTSPSLAAIATVVASHDGGRNEHMQLTVGRFEEIRRQLSDGRGVKLCRNLCTDGRSRICGST